MDKPRNLIVRQLFPTPIPATPLKMRCVSVYIPDSMDHLAAFAGALALLGKWNSWQKDDTHTARQAAIAWQQCLARGITDCGTQEPLDGIILEDDMGDNIRVDPDNSCIIQIKCCGEWTTLIDISKCVPHGAIQPTDGSGMVPGECREWDVSLRGSDRWLLPATVSENDTVQISAVSGAWSDGTLGWNCPNGFTFALNVCVSVDPGEPTDPVPALNHMRLIMSVDGTFTDAYLVLYSVPAGVSDGQVFFQANDQSLEDNSGTIAFHVKLCKAPEAIETIDITYTKGTGPASVSTEGGVTSWVIGLTSTVEAAHNDAIRMSFSEDVSIEILSAAGWSDGGIFTSGQPWSDINESGTSVELLTWPTQNYPTQFSGPLTGNGYTIINGHSGSSAVPYSIQMRVTKL